MSRRVQISFDSPIGRLRVMATAEHVVEVKLNAPDLGDGDVEAGDTARPDQQPVQQPVQQSASHGGSLAARARDEILAFLDGDLEEFTVPCAIHGSPFQQRVLRAMSKIAYGRTQTYGQLARRVGDPGASRAVGATCGSNPLPLIVPCHRVVASNGLGGFGGGLAMKRWLLTLEATRKPPGDLALFAADAEVDRRSGDADPADQLSLF